MVTQMVDDITVVWLERTGKRKLCWDDEMSDQTKCKGINATDKLH